MPKLNYKVLDKLVITNDRLVRKQNTLKNEIVAEETKKKINWHKISLLEKEIVKIEKKRDKMFQDINKFV